MVVGHDRNCHADAVDLQSVDARIGLPFGLGEIGGQWRPDDAERSAAWEMYVELITRVSLVELRPDDGLLREALSSLHTLFDTTREILRRYGPSVAQASDGSSVAFGHLAVSIINGALRPLLGAWHPLLEDHEHNRPANRSRVEWERSWDRYDELRGELSEVQASLVAYARLLGRVCGAPDLVALVVAPGTAPDAPDGPAV